jgi:hypothetical protein
MNNEQLLSKMKERYWRDKNKLSRVRTPFYKGNSSDDGRDGDIFTHCYNKE